jgi:hypothetical protein
MTAVTAAKQNKMKAIYWLNVMGAVAAASLLLAVAWTVF